MLDFLAAIHTIRVFGVDYLDVDWCEDVPQEIVDEEYEFIEWLNE